jgi:UDP-N-acetylmuramoyl-tripeptide--D-alanyl-D-alanine ligase
MIWDSQSLSSALGIIINSATTAGKLQFNSNDVENGDLFIALSGNQDGHDYVSHALEKGASAVIVSKDLPNIPDHKIIKVDDTHQALFALAQYKRANSKAKFIAITGSVGKTSTKEAMRLLLTAANHSHPELDSGSIKPFNQILNQVQDDYDSNDVFAGRGNFNNYLGLQINLASMPDCAKYAVFEMGMNHKGEIAALSSFIKPDIAIITNISEAHMEFFDGIDGIIEAKCEIFDGMSEAGIAIINKFYEKIYNQIKKIALEKGVNHIYSFGGSVIVDVSTRLAGDERQDTAGAWLNDYRSINNRVEAIYKIDDTLIKLNLPFIPKFHCENFAACFLAIKALGLDLNDAADALSNFELMHGRGKIINANKGQKKYQIICDHYNASPGSMRAALVHFAQVEHPKKTIIIGDMLELGASSHELHKDLIPFILLAKANKVLLVGEAVKDIINNLPQNIIAFHFDDVKQLIEDLSVILDDNELILIKASKKIGFEKILSHFDQIQN